MLPGHRNLSTIRAMQEPSGSSANAAARSGSTAEVFAAFLRLGLTSFGGPIAHLGYFHEEFVVRRKWLDEKTYVDLVALSQFLPGPASSKVGIALGLSRAGYAGALAAWTGFTLPSAIALVLFRYAPPADHASLPHPVSRTVAIVAIVAFFAILIGLPLVVAATANHSLQLFEVFYRASSLVFGGGHVVLPLLQAAVVPPGWVSNDAFLAGYG